MLAALSIRDIVLIDRLDLQFHAGMTAFTGETGAGKSILLDAFALALGARGDPKLVRAGAALGQVTAQFDLVSDHPALALAVEHGVEAGDDLVLRRVQTPDGRAKAFINDAPVSVQTLRRVGALLVEIHGQHDDRAFTESATHRRLLDAYGGLSGDATQVEAHWRAWREAEAALAERRDMHAAAQRSLEYARHAADELEALDCRSGEEDALAEDRQRMQNASRIAAGLDDIATALSAGGLENKLGGALRRLERQPGARPSGVAAAVERVLIEVAEAAAVVKAERSALDFNDADLEQAEARLFKLRETARKYRCAVADLPGLAERFRAECAAADAADAERASLEAETEAKRHAYVAAARRLSEARRAAATRLDAAVGAELPALKLDRARFMTDLAHDAAGGPSGFETASFTVRTNPGADAGPLMKVASGGELSRFILALKVALAQQGSAPTLVFDEVDQGVGGATAAAIGERLATLSRAAQVLAVTHSPQVAAHADHHLVISKQAVVANGIEAMVTRAAALDSDGRVEEIARMLAGARVTNAARRAAASLMGAPHG
ncbi:MAG: DNA repair protein RecN [Hyphomicrobiales bacterium]|nr:DNA repair protein RecN [Hyphomicrobiales bacterium]